MGILKLDFNYGIIFFLKMGGCNLQRVSLLKGGIDKIFKTF